MARWRGVFQNLLACGLPIGVVALVALVAGCPGSGRNTIAGNGGAGGSTVPVVSYHLDIQPIFDTYCTSCHSAGGAAAVIGIGLDLTPGNSYQNLFGRPSQESPNFFLIEPGSPDTSWLYMKVGLVQPPVGLRMPPFRDPIPDADIQLIRQWILQGALSS